MSEVYERARRKIENCDMLDEEEKTAVLTHWSEWHQGVPVERCLRHGREYAVGHGCPSCEEEALRRFHAAHRRGMAQMQDYLSDPAETVALEQAERTQEAQRAFRQQLRQRSCISWLIWGTLIVGFGAYLLWVWLTREVR